MFCRRNDLEKRNLCQFLRIFFSNLSRNDGVRSPTGTSGTYKVNAAVSMIWYEGLADSTNQMDNLRLPGPGIKGSCDRDRVVRFAENRQTSCDIAVTSACPAELSARSYIVGGNLTDPACPRYPAVLAAKENVSWRFTAAVRYF